MAMHIFDRVHISSLNDVHSDMNRTMYLVFNRMCFCYVRWRRYFRAKQMTESILNYNSTGRLILADYQKRKTQLEELPENEPTRPEE